MAQPEMLNNPNGYVSVRLFLDMTTKKKAKFMDEFKGAVYYPNTFKEGIQKEVIAICKVIHWYFIFRFRNNIKIIFKNVFKKFKCTRMLFK